MAVDVAVAVSGGVAVPLAVPVAVPVAGLTKRFLNHIQKRSLNQCLGLQGFGGILLGLLICIMCPVAK